MGVRNSANWYESHLSSIERKTRGHFSTPPALVERILDACGYSFDDLNTTLHSDPPDITSLRILDPACGSGNFLSAIVRRLVTYGRRAHLSEEQLCTLLQNNLWGFDPDPIACFLAEMQVRTTLEAHNLFPNRLHIHQADGLAFPWHEQSECIDLFLANPPYLATKNTDLSFYRFAEGRGQVDSYLLFLEMALHVVRPGGWMGLVVPDAVLARTNAVRERRRLLQETTIHALWHLSGVFPAYVGAVVLVAQKNPPPPLHAISWRREKWYVSEKRRQEKARPPAEVPQSLLRTQSGGELRYLLGGNQQTLIARLQAVMQNIDVASKRAHIIPLHAFVTIKRGEELGKGSYLLADALSTETHFPLLRGGIDIRPYTTPQSCYCLARDAIAKPLYHYSSSKLLVVKSTPRLQAALDIRGHVVLQTLYALRVRQAKEENEIDVLYYLLALLNSNLLRNYVYVLHTAYKWVQPQIEQHVLANLPIPTFDTIYFGEIVQRAKAIMAACDEDMRVVELSNHIQQLHTEQERTIVAMYQDALDRSINKGVN